MNAVLAVAALVALFVAFGVLNRGAERPSCHGCDHDGESRACAACGLSDEHRL